MDCSEMEVYLADHVQGRLGLATSLRVSRHLKKCQACRIEMLGYQKTLTLLEYDILPEPPLQTWKEITEKTLEISQFIPGVPQKKKLLRYYPIAASFLLVCMLFAWLLSPSQKSPQEYHNGSYMFWTFFNSDLWDFDGFFRKVNEEKLAKMTPHIEREVQNLLKRELELTEEDVSRLFPLLKKFGYTSREYYYRYYAIMESLSQALESDKIDDIAKYLEELKSIRRAWFDSQWELLNQVQLVLNNRKFARFLLFIDRMPQELYTIYSDMCSENG